MLIRHLCHQKLCVNLNHLAIGNSRENAMDSVMDGNSSAKFNTTQIKEIMELIEHNVKVQDIAKLYSASNSTISNIKTGNTYSHITGLQCIRKSQLIEISRYRNNIYSQTKIVGECLVWTGLLSANGYGKISINQRTWSAHRAAYTIEYGEIPNGLIIRHLCNNKVCINIKHLIAGTQAKNMQDVINSDHNSFAKLKINQVMEIRCLLKDGKNKNELSEQFCVAPISIQRIADGITWKNIKQTTSFCEEATPQVEETQLLPHKSVENVCYIPEH